jgi:hypothetical protein
MSASDSCGLRSTATVQRRDGMYSQHVALFTAIDEYVKAHQRCFVAERFLGPSETE